MSSGIPVVISTNGYGLPVKAVTGNAPVMTVAANGYGTPIVLSDNGTPFIVQGGGGPPPAPTLNALTVSPSSATVGQPYSGAVSGKTTGSALSLSGAGAAGLSVVGAAITGTPTTAGAVNVIETLAGATNTPRTSNGVVSVAASGVPADEIAFTPQMMQPFAFVSIHDQTTMRKQDGSQATVAADEIWTWQDLSGNSNHAVAQAGSGAAGTSANAGRLGADATRVGGGTLRPVVSPGTAMRLNFPTGWNTSGPSYFIVFGKVLTTQPAADVTILAHSGGNFATNGALAMISKATTAGATLVGLSGNTNLIETNPNPRNLMLSGERLISTANPSGRLNGSETAVLASTTWGNNSTRIVGIGACYNSSSAPAANSFAYYGVLLLNRLPTRWEMQALEGWARKTYGEGISISSGHVYETADPTVPAGTTSVVGWQAINEAVVLGPWLGAMSKSFNDSYSNAFNDGQGAPPAGASTVGLEAPFWNATQTTLDQISDTFFPGGGKGARYVGIDFGFAERGYRRINGTSGLADLIGSRYTTPGNNGRTVWQAMKYAIRRVADVSSLVDKNAGGGLFVQHHSFAPEFKTTSAFSKGTISISGGSTTALTDAYMAANTTTAKARLLYLAQCVVNDWETVHQQIGPVKIATTACEASNPEVPGYGSAHPIDPGVQVELMKRCIELARASSILSDLTLYGGGLGQNVIRFHMDAMYGAGTNGAATQAALADTEILATGKTLAQELWGASRHDLTAITGRNVGGGTNQGSFLDLSIADVATSGGDIVRSNTLSDWTTAAMRSANVVSLTDELEDFNTNISKNWRFINRLLVWFNLMNLHTQSSGGGAHKGGLAANGPLYWSKMDTSNTVDGYVLSTVTAAGALAMRSEGQAAVMGVYNDFGWNSPVYASLETPGSTMINQKGVYLDQNGSKRVHAILNRSNNAYAPGTSSHFSKSPKLMKGTRYTLSGSNLENVVVTDLGLVNATAIPINLPAWSHETWVEQ